MKILHTSDWHLGQVFYEYDRSDEHLKFFGKLSEIIRDEEPDVLLVSGDVYHNSLPSVQSQRLFTQAMLGIVREFADLTIVVTAGNHDSGSRLELNRELWSYHGMHIVGSPYSDGTVRDLEKFIIEVPSRGGAAGTIAGFVIALPYIYEHNYPRVGEDSDSGAYSATGPASDSATDSAAIQRQRLFYAKIAEMVKERNPEGLPVLMMAHLSVSGCDTQGHKFTAGGSDSVPVDIFPESVDYVALGHIHKPQTLSKGRPVVRYSGTPVCVNFGENYPHSVSIVEVGTSGVKWRTVEVPQAIPMKLVPENPAPIEEALKALEDFPAGEKAYIKLNVLRKGILPSDAKEKAAAAAEGKSCRYCGMAICDEVQEESLSQKGLTVEEVKSLSPLDIAKIFYRRRTGTEMAEEDLDLLKEILTEKAE